MATTADHLDDIRREYRRLRRLAERALDQMDDRAYFAAPSEGTNSAAVVVKHMAGNMWSRWREFLTSDGEKPDRNRDGEFVIGEEDTRERLTAAWERGWTALFAAIDPLGPEDLDRTVTIRGEGLTVWQAILRQLTHYAYHVGQIVTLARNAAGERWVSLSVPPGQSAAFNARPKPYLES
jgi:hypothetical protein